jgi:prolyl-tRNA synthetase
MKASTLWLPDLTRSEPPNPQSSGLMEELRLIRKAATGIYTLLPLGTLVFERMKRVVRKHMLASGAQEAIFATMMPARLWQESGRWDGFGSALIKATIRGDAGICFNPTHEEIAVAMIRDELRSFRQLPLNFFCIQKVYRDEPRPKSGLLRTSEFVMADSYSFHRDPVDAEAGYLAIQQVYRNILADFELPCDLIAADNGVIGGSKSVEFQFRHPLGESKFATCDACGYAGDVSLTSDDRCPRCNGALVAHHGIELAHVFLLETRYSAAMGLTFRDQDNLKKPPYMGCTGIGLTRSLQAIVLNRAFAGGVAWPRAVAPFEAVIVLPAAASSDPQPLVDLYHRLTADSFQVLLDDRDMPQAPKRKLLDLIHAPVIIEFDQARAADGVNVRADGITQQVGLGEVLNYVRRSLRPWP